MKKLNGARGEEVDCKKLLVLFQKQWVSWDFFLIILELYIMGRERNDSPHSPTYSYTQGSLYSSEHSYTSMIWQITSVCQGKGMEGTVLQDVICICSLSWKILDYSKNSQLPHAQPAFNNNHHQQTPQNAKQTNNWKLNSKLTLKSDATTGNPHIHSAYSAPSTGN